MKAVKGYVYGRVQGVGFRMFTYREALSLGLRGWVRNCLNGCVEFHCEGPEDLVDTFLRQIEVGPMFSKVDRVESQETKPLNHQNFEIRV